MLLKKLGLAIQYEFENSIFFLTQSWMRYYRKKQMKSGRIVMMASDTSGMGSTIPYGLSKAGISSFTYGLAKN